MEYFHLATRFKLLRDGNIPSRNCMVFVAFPPPSPCFLRIALHPIPGTPIRPRAYLDIIWSITRARVAPATPATQPVTTGYPTPHHHHTPPVPHTLPMHPPMIRPCIKRFDYVAAHDPIINVMIRPRIGTTRRAATTGGRRKRRYPTNHIIGVASGSCLIRLSRLQVLFRSVDLMFDLMCNRYTPLAELHTQPLFNTNAHHACLTMRTSLLMIPRTVIFLFVLCFRNCVGYVYHVCCLICDNGHRNMMSIHACCTLWLVARAKNKTTISP